MGREMGDQQNEKKKGKALPKKHLTWEQEAHAALANMLTLPGNGFCADCLARDPRWASWNLGVFLCIRCSGIHRSLGTHVSKVKSTNMDLWSKEQLDWFQTRGNVRANDMYEAKLDTSTPRPLTDYEAEAFIKAKYVEQRWAGGPIQLHQPARHDVAAVKGTREERDRHHKRGKRHSSGGDKRNAAMGSESKTSRAEYSSDSDGSPDRLARSAKFQSRGKVALPPTHGDAVPPASTNEAPALESDAYSDSDGLEGGDSQDNLLSSEMGVLSVIGNDSQYLRDRSDNKISTSSTPSSLQSTLWT